MDAKKKLTQSRGGAECSAFGGSPYSLVRISFDHVRTFSKRSWCFEGAGMNWRYFTSRFELQAWSWNKLHSQGKVSLYFKCAGRQSWWSNRDGLISRVNWIYLSWRSYFSVGAHCPSLPRGLCWGSETWSTTRITKTSKLYTLWHTGHALIFKYNKYDGSQRVWKWGFCGSLKMVFFFTILRNRNSTIPENKKV